MPRLRPARRRSTNTPGDSRSPALALSAAAGHAGAAAGSVAAEDSRQSVITTTRKAAASSGGDSADPGAGLSWPSRALSTLRYHWLAAVLLLIGLVLRVITWMAYHPALLYIDSVKYLYRGWQGSDPLGYKIPLKIVLAVGSLGTVTALQHLLGLGMGVAIYMLLVRRGVSRWLGALAIAPVLLDGYQLQAEATIMPDVLFEGMVVAGLCILLWKPTISWLAVIASGLILGLSATVRELGLWMLAPAVLCLLGSRYLRVSRDDWYSVWLKSCVLALAFLLPVVTYCGISYEDSGHFRLSVKGSAAGRMAQSADCATLKAPADVLKLCPPPAMQKQSPDWLEHSSKSSLLDLPVALGPERLKLTSEFDHAVERQQPLRVVASVLRDSVRLFEVDRVNSIAITPIFRWQFQTSSSLKYHAAPPTSEFQQYDPEFMVCPIPFSTSITPLPQTANAVNSPYALCSKPGSKGDIIVGLQQRHNSPWDYVVLNPSYGGKAQVNSSLASFLRSYQLDGGFTPGPLLLIFTLTGLLGSLIALIYRRGSPRARNMALASLAFFVTAVGLLLIADLYVFSWRYQLQALVTLPPAGVLGAAAAIHAIRYRRQRVLSPSEVSPVAGVGPAAEVGPAPAG
ncbi:MAG TPA: hypothetical protein VME44_18380 [Streptosporangiaceae bacterium]|nr:hypothetical protein [Streptosporangiaceae bacterium]